ncbi:MAG: orotidine 5'-phosphate decarboxylase, partial [Candidatus Aenigmarchaeota archaeon]|nr:orotidine 5'-phosphate decarboxylase [Candidatus Aenigmarchaeota archaeon]
ERMMKESKRIVEHMKNTVRATAKHVSGYKMNEQSMLTFLLAQNPNLVHDAKQIYSEETGVEPVIWTDEKLRDIPSTTYQTARIIYGLGYDAIHCMPQIGQDVSGALQKAAEEMGNRGTVHVINLTHPGYEDVKRDYHKDPVGTINLMREGALGSDVDVEIGKERFPVNVKATGTIEPANRPDEIYQGLNDLYGDNIMIISIGIGPQGALPGCALYSGASIEGIGRFIFQDGKEFSTPENTERKSRACKRSCLLVLDASYSEEPQPYPLDSVMEELSDFSPSIRDLTKDGLERVYKMRMEEHGL